MFRGGGKISSYNKGIASGLGYMGGGPISGARGGQIGGGRIAGSYFPDGRYGFANPAFVDMGGGSKVPTKSVINQGGNILKRNINRIKNLGTGNLESRIGQGIKGLYNLLPEEGLLAKGSRFVTSQLPKTVKGTGILAAISGPGMIAEANRPKTYAALQYMKDMNQSGAFDETAMPTMDGELGEYDQFMVEFNKLNDPSKYSAIPDDRGFFNKYINPMGALVGISGDKSSAEIEELVDKEIKKNKEPTTEAEENPGKEITVNTDGRPSETVLSRKERLKKKADEYQEILGEGIKKDSIFDAMVEGGSRLLEGEGWGAAARAANKSLDPIQNIKTASRKLALEEDIALKKAIATAASKNTDISRKIDAMKAGGYSPQQIANAIAGMKPETLGDKVAKLGKVDGYAEYVKENFDIQSVVNSKTDLSGLPEGKYYIADKFTIVEIDENGKLVPGSKQVLKQS
tara:strand:+ start:7213 stop:8589 length:1377 start_codon:yes stop_codon:yes gene_type:complete